MPQPASATPTGPAQRAKAEAKWEKPELVRLEPGSPAHSRARALLQRQDRPS